MEIAHLENNFNQKLPDISTYEWEDCDCGMGDSRLHDTTVRLCKRIKTDWSKLFDLTDLFKLWDFNNITLTDMQILKYEEGSHFRQHIDTMYGDHHTGTLLLVYPSEDLEGGNMHFYTVDKREKSKTTVSYNKPYALYIPLGTFHEVDKLTKGNRIVFKSAVVCSHYNYEQIKWGDHVILIHQNTRILPTTGKYMPTNEEIKEQTKNSRRPVMAHDNVFRTALGLPTYKD
jgi:hypothetical protein